MSLAEIEDAVELFVSRRDGHTPGLSIKEIQAKIKAFCEKRDRNIFVDIIAAGRQMYSNERRDFVIREGRVIERIPLQ